MFHEKTKHIDVRFHFIKEVVSSGLISLEKGPIEDNLVDMAIKVLPVNKFKYCLDLIRVEEE